jgi:hypothetical protein
MVGEFVVGIGVRVEAGWEFGWDGVRAGRGSKKQDPGSETEPGAPFELRRADCGDGFGGSRQRVGWSCFLCKGGGEPPHSILSVAGWELRRRWRLRMWKP